MASPSFTDRWLEAGKRRLRHLLAVPKSAPAPFPISRSHVSSRRHQIPETTLVLTMLMLDGLATDLYRVASNRTRPHDPKVDWAEKHEKDVQQVIADLKEVVGANTFLEARGHMSGEFDRPLSPTTRPRKGLNVGPSRTVTSHWVDDGTLLAAGLIIQGLADLVAERGQAGAAVRVDEFWRVIGLIEAAAGPIVTVSRDRNSQWKTALEYVL